MIAKIFAIARRAPGARLREDGNVALIFGLTFPVLLGLAGLAIDGVSVNHQSSHMQNAADAAALAMAKELRVYRAPDADPSTPTPLEEAGKAAVAAYLEAAHLGERPREVDVLVDAEGSTVEVRVAMPARTFLPSTVWAESPIRVSSVAYAYGTARLCVLGLNRREAGTIGLRQRALVSATECAIQSNSASPEGIEVTGDSKIESGGNCSAGGVDGGDAISPKAEVDCPPMDDPLVDRIAPIVSGCDYLDYKVEKGAITLSPGVYCGGITMRNDSVVDLNPGLYVITGGKLDMKNMTVLRGEGVTFYFADDEATFEFRDKGLVELSAPKDGPTAGILFFSNRNNSVGQRFSISSDSARKLLGTIYLPNATLEVGGSGKVADASEYTVIVVDQLEVETANLVVNANYAASDVPVPEGLGPNSTSIALER